MKADALAGLRMGPVVKVILQFRDAFWESGELEDLAFVHASDAAFPTWWTQLPVRAPVLTGWAGGPAATRLAGQDDSAILDAALHSIAPILHRSPDRLRDRLVGSHVANWQTDPFARGAYGHAAAGAADAPEKLAQPVADTLFFAGE